MITTNTYTGSGEKTRAPLLHQSVSGSHPLAKKVFDSVNKIDDILISDRKYDNPRQSRI